MASQNGKHWIGLDLGGTKMLTKVYDAKFADIAQQRTKTKGHEGVKAGLTRIVETITEALDKSELKTRDIAGIGIDTGSVDAGNARGFPVHGVVNGSGAFHLENLADLGALPESGAYLVVAPIKIQGGSGGQVRVFAVIP